MDLIDGKPDPWGMKVNPAYRGLQLPRDEWPLLDTYVPKTQNECRRKHPAVYFNQLAAPVSNCRTIAEALLDGWPEVQTRCDFDLSTHLYKLGRIDPQSYGSRFMLGIVSLGDVARYGLRCAALETRPGTLRRPDRRLAVRRGGARHADHAVRSLHDGHEGPPCLVPCLPGLDGRLHRCEDRAPRPGRRRQGGSVHQGLDDARVSARAPATASSPRATCRSGTAG